MSLKVETMRSLCTARELLHLGKASLSLKSELQLFPAMTLLQDAAEHALLGFAHHLDVTLDAKTDFDKYLVRIDQALSPNQLPFKAALMKLNKVRVQAKHHGIQPDRAECERLCLSLDEFLRQATIDICGVNFSTVSGVDLLEDGEAKNALIEATSLLEAGDLGASAIACRKALYLTIEHEYDISLFSDGKNDAGGILGPSTKAPYYTRNKAYIDKYVKEPCDFIALDIERIERDLLKMGISPTQFWNLQSFTPLVYRTQHGQWIVRHDFHRLSDEHLNDNMEYILAATTDIALAVQKYLKQFKSPGYSWFSLELKNECSPVYEKADKKSQIRGHLPKGLKHITTSYRTVGLDGSNYWEVSILLKGGALYGFLHADDASDEAKPIKDIKLFLAMGILSVEGSNSDSSEIPKVTAIDEKNG